MPYSSSISSSWWHDKCGLPLQAYICFEFIFDLLWGILFLNHREDKSELLFKLPYFLHWCLPCFSGTQCIVEKAEEKLRLAIQTQVSLRCFVLSSFWWISEELEEEFRIPLEVLKGRESTPHSHLKAESKPFTSIGLSQEKEFIDLLTQISSRIPQPPVRSTVHTRSVHVVHLPSVLLGECVIAQFFCVVSDCSDFLDTSSTVNWTHIFNFTKQHFGNGKGNSIFKQFTLCRYVPCADCK